VVKKEERPSFLTQTWVLTKRSFVNMYRDLGYYWLRFAIYIALCLCVGTIYYNIGHSYGSIQVRQPWPSLTVSHFLFFFSFFCCFLLAAPITVHYTATVHYPLVLLCL
jgi:hypothetical protein